VLISFGSTNRFPKTLWRWRASAPQQQVTCCAVSVSFPQNPQVLHTLTRVFTFRGDELGRTTFMCWTLNRGISSPVSWTGTGLVGLETESKEKIKCWLGNQHATLQQVLNCTQRQSRELISGPSPAAKTRLLSFNRTQLRVVTDRLTWHNTLRRHLYMIALNDSPLCRRCGEQKENSAHIFCVREVLATLRHTYLGSIF
jgi:hypothetical protein